MWPYNTGDCLIEVTTWEGLIVLYNYIRYHNIDLLDNGSQGPTRYDNLYMYSINMATGN